MEIKYTNVIFCNFIHLTIMLVQQQKHRCETLLVISLLQNIDFRENQLNNSHRDLCHGSTAVPFHCILYTSACFSYELVNYT